MEIPDRTGIVLLYFSLHHHYHHFQRLQNKMSMRKGEYNAELVNYAATKQSEFRRGLNVPSPHMGATASLILILYKNRVLRELEIYLVFIICWANFLTSLTALGARFLKVTPYNRLLRWIV